MLGSNKREEKGQARAELTISPERFRGVDYVAAVEGASKLGPGACSVFCKQERALPE